MLSLGMCPKCGFTQKIDNDADAWICQSCKAPFIVANTTWICGQQTHYTEKDFVIRGGILETYNGASVNPIIPNGVKEIGTAAFENLRITSIHIPEGVDTIGSRAFALCKSLKSIVIPQTVRKIDEQAFVGCSSLEHIEIPNGVNYLPKRTFSGCKSLNSVILPEGLTDISEAAFQDCISLKEIVIPSSIKNIAYEERGDEYSSGSTSAFSGCSSLNSVILPFDAKKTLRSTADEINSSKEIRNKYYILRAFEYTPWYKALNEEYQQELRKASHRCIYCGHIFNPFTKKCTHCGKPKSY